MPTGNYISLPLNASSAPTLGALQQATVSFGGAAVLQACTNLYLEVILSDPTNTGDPATFEVQIMAGMGDINNPIGGPIAATGLTTVTASSPFTAWTANLVALSGGVSPVVTVRGVAGE
jgi:hypothetical protein